MPQEKTQKSAPHSAPKIPEVGIGVKSEEHDSPSYNWVVLPGESDAKSKSDRTSPESNNTIAKDYTSEYDPEGTYVSDPITNRESLAIMAGGALVIGLMTGASYGYDRLTQPSEAERVASQQVAAEFVEVANTLLDTDGTTVESAQAMDKNSSKYWRITAKDIERPVIVEYKNHIGQNPTVVVMDSLLGDSLSVKYTLDDETLDLSTQDAETNLRELLTIMNHPENVIDISATKYDVNGKAHELSPEQLKTDYEDFRQNLSSEAYKNEGVNPPVQQEISTN